MNRHVLFLSSVLNTGYFLTCGCRDQTAVRNTYCCNGSKVGVSFTKPVRAALTVHIAISRAVDSRMTM